MKKEKNLLLHNQDSLGEAKIQKLHYEEFSYKKQGEESKQVFIDLDDAYGVPFSSGAFVLTDATKQESKKS